MSGTDILPAELPKESSYHFGSAVVKVLNELFESRSQSDEASVSMDLKDGPEVLVSLALVWGFFFCFMLILPWSIYPCRPQSNACITTNRGELAPRFQYLDSFLKLAPSTTLEANQSIDVLITGHL